MRTDEEMGRLSEIEKRLEDLLQKGLIRDVHAAENACSIYAAIASCADEVNQAGYGRLFGILQLILLQTLVMSVRRLFDPPPRRFRTRSVPGILYFVESHAKYLTVRWPGLVKRKVLSIDPSAEVGLDSEPVKFTRSVVRVLKHALEDEFDFHYARTIDAIRNLGDKSVAHNEALGSTELGGIAWEDTQDLLRFVKSLGVIVGQGYLTTLCEDSQGRWALDYGPEELEERMVRLIRAACRSSEHQESI